MAIALVQRPTPANATGVTSVGLSFTGTPTAGNLMLASLTGSEGGTTGFTPPAGWLLASGVIGAVGLDVAIFYKVVVADGVGPYVFAQAGGTDNLTLELEEWGGFGTGTIGVDLSASVDAGPAFTASVSGGTTTTAVQLVKVLCAVGGVDSTPAGTPWLGTNQVMTSDTALSGNRFMTGHFITTTAQSFTTTTAQWANTAHSNTITIASFKVTVSGGGITLVERKKTSDPANSGLSLSFTSTPTVGDLMLASCCGSSGTWTPPLGWAIAARADGELLTTSIFWRQVQPGDGVGPYTFSEGTTDSMELELEEWTGFPAGTIVVDRSVLVNTPLATSGTTATLSPGTTVIAVELVKAVIGVGGPGIPVVSSWAGGLTTDSAFINAQMATAHLVLAATTNLTPSGVTWSGAAHSSTFALVSFGVGTPVAPITRVQTVPGTTASGTVVQATFPSLPAVGNLLVASVAGGTSGAWSGPTGWALAVATPSSDVDSVAIFWQVAAAVTGPYQFTNPGTDALELELEEWTGFPAGTTITLDVAVVSPNGSDTGVTLLPTATTDPTELLKVAAAVSAPGGTGASWTQGFMVDSAFVATELTTAHLVATTLVAVSPLVGTWTAVAGGGVITPPPDVPPPVTPPPVPVGLPSDLDLLNLAPGVGTRSSSFVFEIIDLLGNVIGTLSPDLDSPPVIDCDITRVQKRQLKGLVLLPSDQEALNPFSDRIRPSMVLSSGSRWPLGVYMFADAPVTVTTYGGVMTGALVDQGLILEGALDQGLSIATGVSVTNQIRSLLSGLHIMGYAVDQSSVVTGAPLVWPAGTNLSDVLGALASLVGYHGTYFNNNGIAISKAVVPNPSVPDLIYAAGQNIFADSILRADTILGAANRFIVVDTSSLTIPVVGTYDVPASAPNSYTQRGYRLTNTTSMQGLPNSGAANAAAAAIAADSHPVTTITFTGPPDPRHDVFAIISVLGDLYRETVWSMTLREGADMSHTATLIYV